MTETRSSSTHPVQNQQPEINDQNQKPPHLCITIRWRGSPPPAASAKAGVQPC